MNDLKRILDVLDARGREVEIESVSTSATEQALLRVLVEHRLRSYKVEKRGNLPRDERVEANVLYVFESLSERQRVRAFELRIDFVVLSTGEVNLRDDNVSAQRPISDHLEPINSRRTRSGILPGVLRAVMRDGQWPAQKELAAELKVTQQAVSRAMKLLEQEYDVSHAACDPSRILDAYRIVDDFRPVMSWELATLDDPMLLRAEVADYLNSLNVRWAFTGILAADRYAPWVVPTSLSIMCEEAVDLEEVGLFRHEAASAGTLMVAAPSSALDQVVFDESGARFTDPLTTWGYLVQRHSIDDDQAAHALQKWMING
ncbi:hypothetical protein [Timonella sp. A28]|uniref:hypothetical protein n=1 Tax=Timonella sp. A28 TaxID=3442640 RepID=UPI003EBCCD5B